ncbi:hypothetical protein V8G54_029984 [Vigna mungo]|uniref:Myb-like domain-containing protein n=1 Tax=Vigna mungo TaxID=3915 RepID=A0AAQ3RJP2_VIGMU
MTEWDDHVPLSPVEMIASPAFLANQLRRKYIPWTAEEEEMLREGVQKFGFNDPKKWKNILAFGSHVFQKVGKRRTPIDLKDKWKNIGKAWDKGEVGLENQAVYSRKTCEMWLVILENVEVDLSDNPSVEVKFG